MENKATAIAFFLFSAVLISSAASSSDTVWRNGKRFDTGTTMTQRATGAPEQLDRVAGFVGRWKVEITSHSEGEPTISTGLAEIAYVNRGHALMETFHSADLGGHEFSSVFFLGYNPGSTRWFLGGADDWTERAWVADGEFESEGLIFTDTRRRNGGIGRTEIRHAFSQPDKGALVLTIAESSNRGKTWKPVETRQYYRLEAKDASFPASTGYGSPRPDRPKEAAAFDFLIGEWNSRHQMTFPNGQQAQWPSNDTGVYALNGAAILEYSWFDVDPNLPDAATTILRLYNRAMRRWESLYLSNRGHAILYFGGRQEGNEIVLGNFETHSGRPPIFRYVFHDIGENSYSWYSERSDDRGASWSKNWIIDCERKSRAANKEAP